MKSWFGRLASFKLFSRRWARPALYTVLTLLGLWILSMALWAGLLLNHVSRLRRMAADPGQVQLGRLANEIHGVRGKFSLLHAELAPVLWASSLFHGGIGAVRPMADAGSELLTAADEALSALPPSLNDLELGSLSAAQLPTLLEALAASKPGLAAAQGHVDAAAADLARIQPPNSSRMEGWISLANRAVQYAQVGFGAIQVAPDLLGNSGPRTYLLLLQNSDELRATGGFISAVGIVHLDHGKVVDMSVKDVYALENWSKWHPDPPAPLLTYMLSEQWALWDANWSPDFSVVAQDAIQLYQVSHPEKIDGVIGITVQGVQMFISGLSPLEVKGLPEPVTPSNFTQILQETWNPDPNLGDSSLDLREWFTARKQAIGLVMSAAMDKALHGQADWPVLARGVLQAFEQRQLMVYTSAEADTLKQLQWDGSLRSSAGDKLMVVDSNVGFNKANSLVNETINYKVILQPNGTGHASVQIDYAHKGQRSGITCQQFKKYDKNVTYDLLRQTCYYDYLRVLVPSGSRLLKGQAQPTSANYLLPGVPVDGKATAEEDVSLHRLVISQFFVVQYGKSLQAHFEYDLPVVTSEPSSEKQYSLILQKQPGTNATLVNVKVCLPVKAVLVSASMAPSDQSDGCLTFSLRLDTDREINVIYRQGQ